MSNQIGQEGTRTLRLSGGSASKGVEACWGIRPCPTGLSFLHFPQGSLDNMTCVLVCFPGAPRPCEEAIRKELALDAALGRRVSGEQAPKA